MTYLTKYLGPRALTIAAAMLTVASAQAQYTLHVLPTPTLRSLGLEMSFVNASSSGYYALYTAYGSDGATHYMLYGPDLTKPPQDLNRAAGPYPNAPYSWQGQFWGVNDKGHCVAEQTIKLSPILYQQNVYFYTHETHTLINLPLPSGTSFPSTAFADPNDGRFAFRLMINDRDSIAGTLWYGYTGNIGIHNKPFRWSPSAGTKEILAGPTDGDALALANNDWLVGGLGFDLLTGGEFTNMVYGYLVGSIATFTDTQAGASSFYPTDQNDFNFVSGVGATPSGSEFPFVETYWIPGSTGTEEESILGTMNPGDSAFATNLDNFGRVFGQELTPNGAVPVLWQDWSPLQTPVPVTSLIPPAQIPGNAASWSFSSMDHAGNIWGGYLDANGNYYPAFLSPNPSNS
jgi:hypothetical protein